MNLDNLSREEMIVGGLAILLAIFLLVLPWFDFSVGPYSTTEPATGTPDGWLGVLALVALLAVVADLAIEKFSPQTQVPAIGGSRTNTRFILAVVAAGFIALKFIFHIHFSGYVSFAWGFYVDVIVVAALVYFTLQARTADTAGSSRPATRPATPAATGASTPPASTPPASTPPAATPPAGSSEPPSSAPPPGT